MFKGAAVVKTHQVSNSSKVGHVIELTLAANQVFRVTKHTTAILHEENISRY